MVDLRDLFMHGEQFIFTDVDIDPVTNAYYDASNPHMPVLPAGADHEWKYPTDAMVDDLFVTTGGRVSQDGNVQLTILSSLRDLT